MSEFLGKLHETAVKFPTTDIWMDSCGDAELDYGLERGIVGATSNPVIIGQVIKNELAIWEPRIKHYIETMPTATEEEITWEVIHECTELRAKKLIPLFKETNGKYGRLSAQTNAKFYRSPEKMLEQAVYLNSLSENIQIKAPTSAAGVKAFEEMTYKGININATVSFTVAQAVAVAEAVERGMNRRTAEGLSNEGMTPVCTIMIGRTDDWVKEASKGIAVEKPDALEWAGVAVMKNAYKIFKERGYRTRLLTAAYRNVYHWSEFVGGDICMTIPFDWHKKINASNIDVVSKIDEPVPAEFLECLKTIPEFNKAYDVDGLTEEEFVTFGAFKKTIHGFISGYEDLLKLVRGYMV